MHFKKELDLSKGLKHKQRVYELHRLSPSGAIRRVSLKAWQKGNHWSGQERLC